MGDQLSAKVGLVGFFDILGYQQLLDNNEVETVVRLLDESLLELPNEIQGLLSATEGGKRPDVGKIIQELSWTSFSDTSLLTLKYDLKSESIRTRATKWVVFLVAASNFVHSMFSKGLPLRGAIHIGEFYAGSPRHGCNSIIAGKCLSEAYQLAQKQEWSGICSSKEASKSLLTCDGEQPEPMMNYTVKRWTLNYRIPFKGGSFQVSVFLIGPTLIAYLASSH